MTFLIIVTTICFIYSSRVMVQEIRNSFRESQMLTICSQYEQNLDTFLKYTIIKERRYGYELIRDYR